MGLAEGSVEGLAVYRQGTSVSRKSQSARTKVATWQITSHHLQYAHDSAPVRLCMKTLRQPPGGHVGPAAGWYNNR